MTTNRETTLDQAPCRRSAGIVRRLLNRAHISKDANFASTGSNNSSDSESSHHGSLKERARGHTPSIPWFTPGPGTSSSKHSGSIQATLSRDLWDEAYDRLRLDRNTAGLVVTYEFIVSQELPDELKAIARGVLSSADGDTDRRAEFMTAIARTGLAKRRGSKTSQVDDVSRMVVEYSKRAVAVELNEYPATALAWSGVCVLTPLLVDPLLHHNDFCRGTIHIIGRIPWYMSLIHMLMSMARPTGSHGDEVERQYKNAKDNIVGLYCHVLEFEMNCICATASAWNQVAKNMVRWGTIGELVDTIRQDDEQMSTLVNDIVTDLPQRQEILSRNTDLDVDVLDKEWRINEESGEETGPRH
ncbi:hypothetical protein GMORB2_1824 [Geosmithia morbida]|uniref:NWD NACHT-NTPase N-terminal domain-containing protein n=1 Tax=Geosmithia morbida TaxID=1094350 RepID=A0A9P4YTA5_9HYPO|nr:uncharacterized protein GMORB2_1824 [Geosmithia morbida]KAF4121417.1 hypothetical protein GMORB2_1824 [Geosmithia morbida]